ncbi:MAG: hypothetical protein PHW80_08345 [Smithellaceae bacterium]|mgnify:FL=1|jgi:hypothetical protein|nr:hypothetical protein [Smithellaceae bacterium]MDD3259671.1 hypothetical protein [Smithellaceae bacterium]MDD3849297.1 hypothetical protein [Smithellaceae bacterium]
MKRIFLLMAALLICACGGAGQVPVWKEKAYSQLDEYKTSFLTGRELSTEPHFEKARGEIAAGNDIGLLSVAYLTKYALHTASLEPFDASEFAKLYRLEPRPADMAYCHFLKGNFSAVDPKALPAKYAGVLKAAVARDAAAAGREIAAIDDPLSRLLACGVWVRYLPADETILQIGIDAASANGWRRPLWAYLEKLQDYYQEKGDPAKANSVAERLKLLKK